MQTLTDFLNNYGDFSFNDIGFSDADNIAMCYMFYMPLEQVVSSNFDDEPQRFSRVASSLFAQRGYEHKQVGLILLKDISVKMMTMARSARYSDMKVVACTEVFQKDPAVQFGACTFLLPNGQIVVVFRGTDDTLTGWEEDFDILLKKTIPSHELATQYLENVAAHFDGDIIVCGHSKGGYVAQYGALFCSNETRARIKRLYNNDGPGFCDYSFMDTDNYKEMLPKYRHFVPQSSFIGMMLSHDDDYTIVKSKRVLGPLQHDLSTWQFDGPVLKTTKKLTTMGKINDRMLKTLVSNLTQDEQKAFDSVLTSVITKTENRGLLDFKDNIVDSVKSDVALLETFDKATLDKVASIIVNIVPYMLDAQKNVVTEELKQLKERFNKHI